jgi:hypothetical protein
VPLAALAAAAALAGAAAACTDVPSDPNTPVSIEFDTLLLPSPAIIAGDTLRDAQGRAAPLRAIVRNIDGDVIADAPVQFVLPDTAARGSLKLTLVGGGATLVSGLNESVAADSIALSTRRQVRIVASIGNLQTSPIELAVVRRPRFLVRTNPDSIVAAYVYGVSDTNKMHTDTLGVRVLWKQSPDSGVRRIRVQYTIVDPASDVLDSVRLIRDTTGRDTTSGAITNDAGYASRRLRIRAKAGATAVDTIVVEARVILGREPGDTLGPVRFRVPVRQSAPPATSP